MVAKRPDFPRLLRVNVTAEDHEGLDRFGHERRGLVDVREGVRARSRGLGVAGSCGVHLGLHDAGVAVVDGAEDRDGAAVPSCVPNEQLARPGRGSLIGRVGHVPVLAAFWAA